MNTQWASLHVAVQGQRYEQDAHHCIMALVHFMGLLGRKLQRKQELNLGLGVLYAPRIPRLVCYIYYV